MPKKAKQKYNLFDKVVFSIIAVAIIVLIIVFIFTERAGANPCITDCVTCAPQFAEFNECHCHGSCGTVGCRCHEMH